MNDELSVKELKDSVYQQLETDNDGKMQLIWQGKVLADTDTVNGLGFRDNTIIFAMIPNALPPKTLQPQIQSNLPDLPKSNPHLVEGSSLEDKMQELKVSEPNSEAND